MHNDWCPCKRMGIWTQAHARGEGHGKKAQIEMVPLQTKQVKIASNPWKWEETWRASPLEPSERVSVTLLTP